MKVVILCGGKGIRYRNDYNELPKALAPIGNVPILWHLLKYFSHYGFNDFVLCTGYKGEEINKYVQTLENSKWNIQCIETGDESPTGERIRQILKYTDNQSFLATYADGLSNIPLDELIAFHKTQLSTATISCIKPRLQYGIAHINESNHVTGFEEKPETDFYINGGFMVFNPEIEKHLFEGDILEVDTFNRLIARQQLSAYKHRGFWKSMDTYKENLELDKMWNDNQAPWKVW